MGRIDASNLQRMTESLVRRLRTMGIEVSPDADGVHARGELALTPVPLETLGEPLTIERARFYTLGHNRLKFYEPSPLFDLPAVDVARCDSARAVERQLRRAWGLAQAELRRARGWLEGIGADAGPAARGGRLLLALPGCEGPPAVVRSESELLLPSAGPLRERSLASPGERRFRIPRSLEGASELELSIAQALDRVASTSVRKETGALAAKPLDAAFAESEQPHRVLVLDDDPRERSAADTFLRLEGFNVDVMKDPLRALAAFSERTYDVVVVDARLPRMDGIEFTGRLRELAGIADLPVLVLDERPTDANRVAADTVRAAAYLGRPLDWREIGQTIEYLLEHYSKRRFTRFSVQLAVEPGRDASERDVTETVSRGGFGFRLRREIAAGAVDCYRLRLPTPLRPIELEARVAYCRPLLAQTRFSAGVAIRRFVGSGEAEWLQLIETLARRERGPDPGQLSPEARSGS